MTDEQARAAARLDASLDAYGAETRSEKRALLTLVTLRLCTCPDVERRFYKNVRTHHELCIRLVAAAELSRLDAEDLNRLTKDPT